MTISLSYPDQSYSTANKPSNDTLKTDLSTIEADVNAHEASTAEHGATGAVVGTTNAQTLTNKTLTSPVINTGISGTAIVDEDNMASDSATKVPTQQSVKAYIATIMSTLNPIGTIREFNVATNPATLLGFGTWTAYGTGRVTVAIDAGQTEFDTVDETGGAKTHTLAESEMPAHVHTINYGLTGTDLLPALAGTLVGTYDTGSTGGGGAHNNLQPYIVVYRWVRTA